jgi:hypothetical protein
LQNRSVTRLRDVGLWGGPIDDERYLLAASQHRSIAASRVAAATIRP